MNSRDLAEVKELLRLLTLKCAELEEAWVEQTVNSKFDDADAEKSLRHTKKVIDELKENIEKLKH